MGYNNTMYRLFKEMLDGYKNNEDGLFEHGVRCMMDQNPENPFNTNSPEAECFFTMHNCYLRWKNHGADMKINRRRMLAAASELCELVSENPYTFDKEEARRELEALRKHEEELIKAAEEKRKIDELAAKKEEQTENTVKAEPPQKVLGVIPNEEETKKSWLKFLHPRR